MLPHQDHGDEGAFDAMAGARLYWMRFFAALRMTAGCRLRSSDDGKLHDD
jgi:hypothetical protein